MKISKFAGALAALTVSMGVASTASADTYILNLTQTQSALPAPYGQVDVTQNGANQLKFVVTLFDGLKFVDTGSHYAFAFALNGAPSTITLGAPAGFGLVKDLGDIPQSPFGGFDYGLTCGQPACGNGASSPYTGPLTFTITGSGLTLAMLGTANSYNGNVVRFAADTVGPNGSTTGTIAGGLPGVPGVPEPATWAMMILGMGMVGMGLRLRRREEFQPAL